MNITEKISKNKLIIIGAVAVVVVAAWFAVSRFSTAVNTKPGFAVTPPPGGKAPNIPIAPDTGPVASAYVFKGSSALPALSFEKPGDWTVQETPSAIILKPKESRTVGAQISIAKKACPKTGIPEMLLCKDGLVAEVTSNDPGSLSAFASVAATLTLVK